MAQLVIQKVVHKDLLDYLKSQGFSIQAIDPEPYKNDHGAMEQRYICGYRINAVVLTIYEGGTDPDFDVVLIHTDFWLLLRHGKITFDHQIGMEITAAISCVNWIFENAETEEDKRKVQSLLKCTYEELPQWDNEGGSD